MRAGPSQEEIRRQNLGALLRQVHVRGALSRAELTRARGLNRSTIGALPADLTSVGLVSEELPRETGRAGRPSLVVRPQSERVFVYALSIGVDRLTAARIGLGGVVLDRRGTGRARGEAPPPAGVGPPARVVRPRQRGSPPRAPPLRRGGAGRGAGPRAGR